MIDLTGAILQPRTADMTASEGSIRGYFPATTMPDCDWWRELWPDPHQVLVVLGIGAGMDVIDLCCGDGLFTAPLTRLARRVSALDLDPHMLERAREKVRARGSINCEFIEADAYDIARLAPWRADAVLMANTFHGVPDKRRLVKAVAAVLKPCGRFVVVNWHRRQREETTVLGKPRGPRTEMRMAPEELRAVIEPAGLGLKLVIELPPYHYGAIFERVGGQATSLASPPT
ncbi:MAG: class I SAM-dependent methyltransferase [Steroidobacteraceae bacterium]